MLDGLFLDEAVTPVEFEKLEGFVEFLNTSLGTIAVERERSSKRLERR